MAQIMESDPTTVWRRHPVAAAVLRTLVVAVPLACACLVGILTGWAIGGADTPAWVVARIVGAGVASMATFLFLERMARRILPLSALLRLSMVFPDRAPDRFSIALRSTSLRRLREWAKHPDDQELNDLAEQVVVLATSLNFHDRRTRGHSERTRAVAELLIEQMQLSPAEANEVRWGAFLHDIGKLLVPATILNKPGKPSPAEWVTLKQHPESGGDLVEPLRPFIGEGVEAVRHHHENFDGSGYPDGLKGAQIPLAARIVAVADCFEVMTAVRSYQRPITIEAARKDLVAQAGTQFDPDVVRSFLDVSLGRLHWALGLTAWMAEVPFLAVLPKAAAQVSAGIGSGTTISTSALTSIAAASFGAVAVVAPVVAHASSPGSNVPPAAAHAGIPVGSSAAIGHPADHLTAVPGDPSEPTTHSTGTSPSPSATGSSASVTGSSPSGTAAASTGQPGDGPVTPAASNGAPGAAGAAAAPGASNVGGNGNAGGVAGANSNAGGNGNAGGVAGANSNAGGNGNAGGVAGANSNAGGNGNAGGVAGANSNAGGNGNAGGVAGAKSQAGGNGNAGGVAGASSAGGNGNG